MNLVLLDRAELDGDGRATLRGRRADHLLDVLRVEPGRTLRIGILDGPHGEAVVTQVHDRSIELRCELEMPPAEEPLDTLVLAVPRPKVLARILEHATALGFARILLTRTWRVDKSHLDSKLFEGDTLREHLIAGLEQGRRTRLPVVERFDRFRPFVEDDLDPRTEGTTRIVADGDAACDTTAVSFESQQAFTVAIGPERGFTPFEVELLASRGFQPVRLPTGILKVETAVAVAHAQLSLLRALGPRDR